MGKIIKCLEISLVKCLSFRIFAIQANIHVYFLFCRNGGILLNSHCFFHIICHSEGYSVLVRVHICLLCI